MQNSQKENEEKPLGNLDEQLDESCQQITITKETECGFGIFRGPALQKLANMSTFIVIYGIAGMCLSSSYTYYSGAISTIEKRFMISSKTTGIVLIGNDITRLLTAVVLSYYVDKQNRPRWIAFGLYCAALYSFLNLLPHLIYGPGKDALQLTEEYEDSMMGNTTIVRSFSRNHLCGSPDNNNCLFDEGSIVPSIIMFIAQLFSGIGATLFHTLGFSYLDDNAEKTKSPSIFSFTFFARTIGPTFGYALISMCLKQYIAPFLTPTINNKDPRWLGAWWGGWLVFFFAFMILATLIGLLPKTLPQTVARMELARLKTPAPIEEIPKASLTDFIESITRLWKNSTYKYIQLRSIFCLFGSVPFWIYLPKYIEIQYQQSASTSNMAAGTMGLIFSLIGVTLAGFVVHRFQPTARYMAAWNITIELLTVAGLIGYSLLGCPAIDKQFQEEVSYYTINSRACNCDYVKFSPICAIGETHNFISACHAGCAAEFNINLHRKVYTNCTYIEPFDPESSPKLVVEMKNAGLPELISGSATAGPCTADCQKYFYLFLSVFCCLKLLEALGRLTNFMISMRCIDKRDKAVSLGINIMANSLALIPSPILFGYIMDSACLVWGKTCTEKGNCWLYSTELLRHRMNYTAAAFIFVGSMFNVIVWKKVKNLKMFDDVPEQLQNNEKSNRNVSNKEDSIAYKSVKVNVKDEIDIP